MSDPIHDAAARGKDSAFRNLGATLRPHLVRLLFVLVMLLLLAAVDMIFPAALGLVFDQVFPERDFQLLGWILAGVLAAYLSRNLFYFAGKYTAVYVGEQVGFEQRKALFERLEEQGVMFHRRNSAGELSSRVINDSLTVQHFIADDLPKLLKSACLFIALTAVVYAVHWQLALVSTLVLPLHLYAFFRFKRPIKRTSKRAQQLFAAAHENLLEVLLNIEAVKGYTAEDQEREKFVDVMNRSRRSQLASKKFYVLEKVVADLLIGLSTIGLLGFGGYEVMRTDGMNPGVFIAFFSYIGMFYPTVLGMMKGFAKLASASASLERIADVFRATQPPGVGGGGQTGPIGGRIAFVDVSFSYSDRRTVLRDVNFDLPAGSRCVIMGPSGCGKTTLVNMIPRFLAPTSGRVLLDGVEVQGFDIKHLRRHIGIAFQDTFLFQTTILENLRYGREDATMDEIIRCAKLTQAHDFISALPEGYDTPLGEADVALSRGERQRLVLARAVLYRPSILILDEATTSIDGETESRIVPAILDDLAETTVLMTTHRQALVGYADTVMRIEGGRVTVEQARTQGLTKD